MSNFPFNYEDLPNLDSLQHYVQTGRPLGRFLEAVVSNDLSSACGCADSVNIHLIPVYAAWLYNKAPIGSFGSPEAYKSWVEKGGLENDGV